MKEKSNNIWMPLYWDRYLRDTSDLTLQEHGAYFMLIKEYWSNEGAICNNTVRIYRACSAITVDEKVSLDTVLQKFFILDNGFWHHKKIDKELKQAIELKRKKSEAGKKGMESRYREKITPVITELVTEGITNPQQNANQLQLQSQDSITHTPISKLNFDEFTDEQKEYFKEKAPDVDIPDLIDTMKNWCAAKGKRYENYYRALQDWAKKEQAKINLTKKRGSYENNARNNQGYGISSRSTAKRSLSESIAEGIARGINELAD